MKNRIVTVTEFKAKCVALLNDVDVSGKTIVVTRRGRALAAVSPVRKSAWRSPEGRLAGKINIPDNLMADRSDLWESIRERRA
jgi:antitoxin (DNA-binding transcriptional repressor) of toxin-antitoxin stability system